MDGAASPPIDGGGRSYHPGWLLRNGHLQPSGFKLSQGSHCGFGEGISRKSRRRKRVPSTAKCSPDVFGSQDDHIRSASGKKCGILQVATAVQSRGAVAMSKQPTQESLATEFACLGAAREEHDSLLGDSRRRRRTHGSSIPPGR